MFVFPEIETKQQFQESGIGFEGTQLQATGAAFREAWVRNPLSSFFRAQELEFQQLGVESPLLSTEEWKKSEYYREGLSFPEGVKQNVAKLVAERKDNERQRQFVMNSGPKGIASTAGVFGVQFIAAALDPVNLAAAFIPVVREARFAQLTTRFGATRARLIKGGAEGTVGAAVVEPIVLGAAYQEQADYTMLDSLYSVGFGAFFGAGIHAGTGKIGDMYRKHKAAYEAETSSASILERYQDQIDEASMRSSMVSLEEGKLAKVDPFYRMADIPEARLARDVEAELDRLDVAELRTTDDLSDELRNLKLKIASAENKVKKAKGARVKADKQKIVDNLKDQEAEILSSLDKIDIDLKKLKALEAEIKKVKAKKPTSKKGKEAQAAKIKELESRRPDVDLKSVNTVRETVRSLLREGENARKLGDNDAVMAAEKEIGDIIAGERGLPRYKNDEEMMRDIEAQNSPQADSTYSKDDINKLDALASKNDEGLNIDQDLADLDMEVKSALEADIMTRQDMDQIISLDKQINQREQSLDIAAMAAMCGVK